MIRFMFLRDKKSQPVGCIAIDTAMGLSYSLSVLNPLDKFDRKLARTIALGRLHAGFSRFIRGGDISTMHAITRVVMQDILTGRPSAPSRARKAAKLWLTINVIGIDTMHHIKESS
jgi:hypothetical protein